MLEYKIKRPSMINFIKGRNKLLFLINEKKLMFVKHY